MFTKGETLSALLSEPELPRAEGGDSGPVQDRPHPRPPGHPLGRHGQPGAAPEAAGCRHPHLGTHAQVRGFRERKQVLHQPWLCYRGLQRTGKVAVTRTCVHFKAGNIEVKTESPIYCSTEHSRRV